VVQRLSRRARSSCMAVPFCGGDLRRSYTGSSEPIRWVPVVPVECRSGA
jgi:hypothetical protein